MAHEKQVEKFIKEIVFRMAPALKLSNIEILYGLTGAIVSCLAIEEKQKGRQKACSDAVEIMMHLKDFISGAPQFRDAEKGKVTKINSKPKSKIEIVKPGDGRII